MASNFLFVNIASGLEPLMQAPQHSHVKQSIVAQISAAVYYQAKVLEKLEDSKAFKRQFSTVIFNQIEKEFGDYIDAKARTSPKSLHHVYEWQKIGKEDARLFKLKQLEGPGISFRISTDLMPSTSFVPTGKGKHRHVFVNKASVMEAGNPVTISPKYSERLVFEVDGDVVYMPKGASVKVNRPGGSGAKNQFFLATSQYFKSNMVNLAIKNSGFQRLFNISLKKAMSVPSDIKTVKYKFSPNIIKSQADFAVDYAFGGVS